ncbi:MAG: site-specific integrase [Prevotellaceae bacterium]|nr:site-specific integrase [Prevotellaceae bacterium]
MSQKKEFRSDNTYLISTDPTDNPKLAAKVLSNGTESLFLDFYFGYEMVYSETLDRKVPRKERRREFLSLYLWQAPRTPIERQHNKDTLELAKRIRYEKSQEMLMDAKGYRVRKKQEVNFIQYFQSYIDSYTKKDIRMLQLALGRFLDFLEATPEYQKYSKRIKPEQITKDMVQAFTEYLQSRSVGEGAKSLYARFKKVIKYAVEHEVMMKNPCTGISIKVDDAQLRKDILSPDEIQSLMSTHYNNENPDIRRAFIFCLYTGLRFCDVKDLTFSNVDFSNKLLKFEQSKTKGHSANSGVVIPLNDGILRLIGEPRQEDRSEELIFPLPTYESCLHALARWTKRAGITKHISWHCARHSFAVNILNNGANIKTVASLLGHSGLRHTEKYTRAIDSLKQEAIDSLPELKF